MIEDLKEIDRIRGVEIKNLNKKIDERGWLIEFLKASEIGEGKLSGQIYLFHAKKGYFRGNHFHKRKVEWFCPVSGKGFLTLQDINSLEKVEIFMDSDNPMVVKIPPNVAHSVFSDFEDGLTIVAYINEEFNPDDPDTFSVKVI